MKHLYLIGSICGIILMAVFCYQHRPYIQKTIDILHKRPCLFSEKTFESGCSFAEDYERYDYCGEEMTITSTVKSKHCRIGIFGGACYEANKEGEYKEVDPIERDEEVKKIYIPCYKSEIKFR